jgi:hypothetical protein
MVTSSAYEASREYSTVPLAVSIAALKSGG